MAHAVRLAPLLSIVCLLAGAGPRRGAAVASQDPRDVQVSAAVKRLKYELPRTRDAAARLAIVESLEEIADPRLAGALIHALEGSMRVSGKIEKELDKARASLQPLLGRKLQESQWKERDLLEAQLGEISERLRGEYEVARALAGALAGQDEGEALDALAGLASRHRSWKVRAEILTALGNMAPGETSRAALVLGTRDRDPRVRQAAVEGLGRLGVKGQGGGEGQAGGGAGGPIEALIDRLGDEEWPVRAAAVATLAKLKIHEGVGPLILAMGNEEGRLRKDMADALETITGQTLGRNVRAWRDWWAENFDRKLDVSPRVRPGSRSGTSYHGIEVVSRAILFVVDISDSMNESAAEDRLPEEGVPERENVARSKFDAAMQELIHAIKALDSDATFDIIVYNHEVRRWCDRMQPASRKNKNAALEFLLGVRPIGGTNIFDALELAFQTAGIGARDRYYRPLVDTIFFLSDGAPSAGRITDTREILQEVARMNRFRKIVIHSIGVGKLNDRAFMQSLAFQNGGRYVQRL